MKRVKISAVLFCIVFLICNAASVFAADGVKLQIYLEPQIMDVDTGEIPVDVCLRNFGVAVPDYAGEVCGVTFKFTYDAERFKIKQSDGTAELYGGTVKNLADVEFVDNNGEVSVVFLDSTLGESLVGEDGAMFGFTLIASSPKALWNSFDTYPLRFKAGSVGAAAYDIDEYKVSGIYNIEAIDTCVGAYNKQIDFSPISIDKAITFTVGSNVVTVNDGAYETDAIPYNDGEDVMIPVRYFAEAVGCEVTWDGGSVTASAYGTNKTLSIKQGKNSKMYLNAAEVYGQRATEEIDGRIYIPLSLVKVVYPNAKTEVNDTRIEIYIP